MIIFSLLAVAKLECMMYDMILVREFLAFAHVKRSYHTFDFADRQE